MKQNRIQNVLIFGGSGFVGKHLIEGFLSENVNVTVVDLRTPDDTNLITFIKQDIRQPLKIETASEFDLVVVLAAVHRTPGHDSREYYETNILGAQNIIDWCSIAKITNIWFLSSISVYGTSVQKISESSTLNPVSDYGLSKMIAEKLFLEWHSQKPDVRKVLICRPSVVFGKGEFGNMTRLVNGIRKQLFFVPSRKPIIKSATYVKEIFPSLKFVADLREPCSIFNLCFSEKSTLQDYVRIICRLGKYRYPPTIPLEFLANFQNFFTSIFGKTYIRFLKLFSPTYIKPEFLSKNGYQFRYSLNDAFEDWWKDSKFDLSK